MTQPAVTRIGVISDTHDYLDPKIKRFFKGVDHILHGGDIGLPWLILQLEEIDSNPKRTLTPVINPTANVLRVGTKLDRHGFSPDYDLCISSTSGEGLEELRGRILTDLQKLWSGLLSALEATTGMAAIRHAKILIMC